jgi:hypothetical protein
LCVHGSLLPVSQSEIGRSFSHISINRFFEPEEREHAAFIVSSTGDANCIRIGVQESVSARGIRMIWTERVAKMLGRSPKCRASLSLFARRFEGAPKRQIRASKVRGRSLKFVSLVQDTDCALRIRLCGVQPAQLNSYAGPANQKLRQPVSPAELRGRFHD